jgi:hypothetical protein
MKIEQNISIVFFSFVVTKILKLAFMIHL